MVWTGLSLTRLARERREGSAGFLCSPVGDMALAASVGLCLACDADGGHASGFARAKPIFLATHAIGRLLRVEAAPLNAHRSKYENGARTTDPSLHSECSMFNRPIVIPRICSAMLPSLCSAINQRGRRYPTLRRA